MTLMKKSGTSRSLLKITDKHINLGEFQLMSYTMSTAIQTAYMIKYFNDLLDILNTMS